MVSLRNARITDAVPDIVAKQPWVKALSAAFGALVEQLLDYTDTSQAFTGVDTAQEPILDALAVYLKVEWYDTTAPIEKKREYIKTALTIQKYAGTAYAVRMQASLIYPSSEVEEWFDYGGTPGRYRIVVNVTNTPAEVYTNEEMEKLLGYTKRLSAHLEDTQYMTKHGLQIGKRLESWIYSPPLCGIPLCGTLWMPSTPGWSEYPGMQLGAQTDAYCVSLDLCGTLPDISTKGWSESGTLRTDVDLGAFAAAPAESGEYAVGTLPSTATPGRSQKSTARLTAAVETYAVTPAQSGTLRCGTVQINTTMKGG